MLLAPLWRTVCLALASGVLLQAALELLAWRNAPLLPVHGPLGVARTLERRLFVGLLASRLLPWIVAVGVLLPAYLRGEENAAAEHVGSACLALAAAAAVGIMLTAARAVLLPLRTLRFCASCRDTGLRLAGRPLLAHRESSSLLAVAGVFRSRFLVSEALLQAAEGEKPALEIAFRHEVAHAEQHDNLKRLACSLLPSLGVATSKRPSLVDRWRLAAELAADEDSTQGDPQRSVALAGLLVALAGRQSTAVPAGIATLLSAPEHLGLRVESLLGYAQACPTDAAVRGERALPLRHAALAALGVAALTGACVLFGHRAAELLLHLG